jgi:hypothetical protein
LLVGVDKFASNQQEEVEDEKESTWEEVAVTIRDDGFVSKHARVSPFLEFTKHCCVILTTPSQVFANFLIQILNMEKRKKRVSAI